MSCVKKFSLKIFFKELAKLKETIYTIERNITQRSEFKDLDRVADILHKTNILLRDKLGITHDRVPSTVGEEIPVIQEEVVETSDNPIADGYYNMEEVEFYEDTALGQLHGLDVRPSTMLCNYPPPIESDYPTVSSRTRLLDPQEVEPSPRSIFYVIQVPFFTQWKKFPPFSTNQNQLKVEIDSAVQYVQNVGNGISQIRIIQDLIHSQSFGRVARMLNVKLYVTHIA